MHDVGLPEAFIKRVLGELGEEALERVGLPNHPCFRKVAGADWSRDEFETIREFDDEVFWVDLAARVALTHSEAATENKIYIQNAASLLPVYALDPKPGETVLDLCAAPGGKTLFIADRMQREGMLSAVEAVKGRFHRLRRNLERYGHDWVRTYLMDGTAVGGKTPERFDAILVDAPCASEARFVRHEPETWKYWSPKKNKEMQKKQRRLLLSAVRALKPSGRIVYSTCTLSKAENEDVLSWLLRREPTLRLQTFELPFGESSPAIGLPEAQRVLASEWMHSFFVAKILRM